MTDPIIEVSFDERTIQKIDAYVAAAIGEIGGMGKVEVRPSGLFVSKVHLFHQVTSEVETVFDSSAYARFMSEMMDKGEDIGVFRLWWHSHGEYKVGWSKTDEATIARLSKRKYLLSMVTNKKGDILVRYDLQAASISVDLPTIAPSNEPPLVLEDVAREVSEKVKFVPYKPYKDKKHGHARKL